MIGSVTDSVGQGRDARPVTSVAASVRLESQHPKPPDKSVSRAIVH